MIKILLSIIIISFTALHSFAQTEEKPNENKVQQIINVVPYRLFPTQNIHIFIKLNTRNGKMWLTQFGDDNNRIVAELNIMSFVTSDYEVNDRFTLYPTQNIYTFLLLDQFDGRIWQVQWGFDSEHRIIVPID